jgi:hypothetical protein
VKDQGFAKVAFKSKRNTLTPNGIAYAMSTTTTRIDHAMPEKKLQDKKEENACQLSDQNMECSPRLNSFFQSSWVNPASETINVPNTNNHLGDDLSRKDSN